ncbi:alkene reductase [Maribacter sp. 2307ULW6-5]|uniref:alkene reductase n=1 Tax=Maribacter sp. 2307ULW6-5 TaxID=3386275 RepID=UPI0039BCA6A7
MKKTQPLLLPYTSNNLRLPNRVVMAPMTRNRATNEANRPTEDLHAKYYAQRSSAGLIISEGTQISEEAVGYVNTPGIHTMEQLTGWRLVTEKVHAGGGRIFAQLWHVGRISHPDFHQGKPPLAPSAINPYATVFTPEGEKETVTPRAMSQQDIDRTVNDFAQAAENALDAGFDGVEIHSSNGYLLHQFFSSTSNHRTDAYGGSHENKTRILFQILDTMKKSIPEQKIGLRLNPSLHGIFGMTLDADSLPTFDYLVHRLNDYDLAYLHLSEPFNDVSDNPHAETEVARRYRPIYKGTLMINAHFDQEKGNAVLERGDADLVAFGKLFISNPDLVERFEHHVPLTDWDASTFYTPGPKGYTDYEAKAREGSAAK